MPISRVTRAITAMSRVDSIFQAASIRLVDVPTCDFGNPITFGEARVAERIELLEVSHSLDFFRISVARNDKG